MTKNTLEKTIKTLKVPTGNPPPKPLPPPL